MVFKAAKAVSLDLIVKYWSLGFFSLTSWNRLSTNKRVNKPNGIPNSICLSKIVLLPFVVGKNENYSVSERFSSWCFWKTLFLLKKIRFGFFSWQNLWLWGRLCFFGVTSVNFLSILAPLLVLNFYLIRGIQTTV